MNSRLIIGPACTLPSSIVWAFAFTVLSANSLNGYVSSIWSYQSLLDKAGLVIIAKVVTITTDTAEQVDHPAARRVKGDKTVGIPVVGVETKFEVLAVLKGEKDTKEVVLHHYREKEEPQSVVRSIGPAYAKFDPATKQPYILFLVREVDGRFGPVSGHGGVGFDSVQPVGWGAYRR